MPDRIKTNSARAWLLAACPKPLTGGAVPVGCTYYVQTGAWNTTVAILSLCCGLVIDTLLMVNNYRDREQNARSGKRTLGLLL